MESQYTSSITGTVLTDIRDIDDKVFNFSPVYKNTKSNIRLTSDITKFSEKSIVLENINTKPSGAILINIPSTNSNNFTLSYWACMHTYNYSYSKNNYITQHVRSNTMNKSIVSNIADGNINRLYVANIDPWNTISQLKDVKNHSLTKDIWYHHAVTYDGSTIKYYENGTLLNSCLYSFSEYIITTLEFSIYNSNSSGSDSDIQIYYDDIVLIANQVLWTSNFTVPNYFLTGDKTVPSKIKNKQILYNAKNSDYNDYFDKAYLY